LGALGALLSGNPLGQLDEVASRRGEREVAGNLAE
jgi:hypothetical protein